MSICALASARARDGALVPGRWDKEYFNEPSSQSFYCAARDTFPRDLSNTRGLDWMRASALLALLGIQNGKIDIMHQYLGLYHSLVAMDNLHDEKNWPKQAGIVEVEERRRLFWSMYTLEVFSSIVWGGVIRCRESQSKVRYPSEVDDEFFSNEGFENPQMATNIDADSSIYIDPSSWLHGWNFTTEMYRILEHAMNDFHRRQHQTIGPFSPSELFSRDAPPQSVVLDRVTAMHAALPSEFKEARGDSAGTIDDIFNFQAANIAATLQLVRMVLFTAEDATVEQKCAVTRELLDGFSNVPVRFLRAMSAPLLHHLAGIGSILGSMIEGPLSKSSYFQVRCVLLAMADLLASLEVGITRTVSVTERLHSHITRIDKYMTTQRQQELSLPNINQLPATNAAHAMASASLGYENQQLQWESQPLDSQSYADISVGIDGLGNASHFQFQLPPELLQDWPWPFDMTHGFGNF